MPQEQADECDRWWRQHRTARDLFARELAGTKELLLTNPKFGTGTVYTILDGQPMRKVMPKTRHHLYYVADFDEEVIIIHAVWGSPREDRRCRKRAGATGSIDKPKTHTRSVVVGGSIASASERLIRRSALDCIFHVSKTAHRSASLFGKIPTEAPNRALDPCFQPFGFAGGLWDRGTNLVRFGARDGGT